MRNDNNYNNRRNFNNQHNNNYNRDNQNENTIIPSPYNFVPLHDKVIFMDDISEKMGIKRKLSEKISHDVPFKNGLSGEIDITLTTESPAYVRNGGSWNDNDRTNPNSKMNEFFQIQNGEFYIPGTSMKGMIRSVFEVATFSKMNANLVDNNRYSIRDLYNPVYTSKLTKKVNNVVIASSKSGWLIQEDGQIKIIPCEYARVEIDDLVKISRQSLNEKQRSVDKYRKWTLPLSITFNFEEKDHIHDCSSCRTHQYRPVNLKMRYKKAKDLNRGSYKGTIVFTGQPSSFRYGDRHKKHMDFIFFDEKHTRLDVPDILFKDFDFIHSDDKGIPNDEWKYWKQKFEKGERVPVFYLLNPQGNSLHSIGLAMMYRLPYDNTIHDMIAVSGKDHLNKDKIDMTEALFGYIHDEKGLKGRVQFGHLKAVSVANEQIGVCKTVLGSPKPTYYPNYLCQAKNFDNYSTYMDKVKLRGRKRYPVEKKEFVKKDLPAIPNNNDKIATLFKPLPKNTVFNGKIRYHNLLPFELGALLWSLTFGNQKNCKHKIGMAKPLGLGIVKVEIKNNQDHSEQYINQFKELVKMQFGNDFDKISSIKHLIAMSNLDVNAPYEVRYPTLDGTNEFVSFKNKRVKATLKPYIAD